MEPGISRNDPLDRFLRVLGDFGRAGIGDAIGVRHLIYTAMLGVFPGTALAGSRYHALLGFAILLAAYLRKTRLEEQILHQTFGAA